MSEVNKSAEEIEHDNLMLTDEAYRERFECFSVPQGRKFTVLLECKSPFQSAMLLKALLSKEHPLVAGCAVHRIDFSDRTIGTDNDLSVKIRKLIAEHDAGHVPF